MTEAAPATAQTIRMSPVGRLERILVDDKGGAAGEAAFRFALDLAERAGADLSVAHSAPPGGWEFLEIGGGDGREAGDARLETARATAADRGVPCTTLLLSADNPNEAVLREAWRGSADLIVTARDDVPRGTRFFGGDPARRIAENAPCPALVVPTGAPTPARVVVATDGSRSSDAATVLAAEIALLLELPIEAVSVRVPEHSERRQAEADVIANRATRYLASRGLQATGFVETGSVVDVIADIASDRAAIIVLGAVGRSGFGEALIGGKARRIMEESFGPILVANRG